MECPQINQAPATRSRVFHLRLGVLWLCAALCLGAGRLLAAQFTMTLDHDTITLGDSANLSLTFEGGQPQDVPTVPEIDHLQVSYVGPSSQFSVINGQVSSTITYNFTVTPQQAGDFVFPAISAVVGGEKLTAQPLRLKVLKPGAPPPDAAAAAGQLAFLRLVLPKKEYYAGEMATGQLQFFVRDGVLDFGNFELTAMPADGVSIAKMAETGRSRFVTGGAIFTMITIQFTMTPVKTGALTIGPITASAVLLLPPSNRNADPFQMFFNRGEQRKVTMATDSETIQSLALPAENVPPTFNGAIGSYIMTVTAGPTNVSAGDPVTVHVQISGRGALSSVALPDQPAWQSFKTFPPTSKLNLTDSQGLQGTKTFEQIVVPQDSTVHELPPVSFTFFDPDRKAYHTETSAPIPLTVRPGGSTPAPTIAAGTKTADNPPPSQDIVPIKQWPGALAQIGPPLVQQPWFLAMQGVPVLAFFSALVWRRRNENLANNPRLRRQREVAQIIRDGLAKLRTLAGENKSDEFFAILFRLLQEQIGERLDAPASSITEAVVEERLRPARAPEPLLASLQELFQACNLARYAPMRTSQELAAVIPKLENALKELSVWKL